MEDLDRSERERFENYFVTTPERRESLRVAKALQQYIVKNGPSVATEVAADESRSAKRSILDILGLSGNVLRFSMAAAVILIVAFSVWLVVRTRENEPATSLHAESANVQPSPAQVAQGGPGQNNQNVGVQPTEGNRSGDAGKNGDDRNSRPPRQPGVRYSFLILPLAQVRGEGGVNEIKLPADAGVVNLKVPLIEEGGYDHYRLGLQTDSDKLVKSWSNLKPTNDESGQIISVDIPAKSLRQQKYRLVLRVVADSGDPRIIGTFHFQVKK